MEGGPVKLPPLSAHDRGQVEQAARILAVARDAALAASAAHDAAGDPTSATSALIDADTYQAGVDACALRLKASE